MFLFLFSLYLLFTFNFFFFFFSSPLFIFHFFYSLFFSYFLCFLLFFPFLFFLFSVLFYLIFPSFLFLSLLLLQLSCSDATRFTRKFIGNAVHITLILIYQIFLFCFFIFPTINFMHSIRYFHMNHSVFVPNRIELFFLPSFFLEIQKWN